MVVLTELMLETFISYQHIIAENANTIIKLYSSLVATLDPPEKLYWGLSYRSNDETILYYEANEYGSYGYHEHHSFELPIDVFLLNEFQLTERFTKEILKAREARLKRENAYNKKIASDIEREERIKYETLKAKFEKQ